jgi:DNA-directed RNA polymerase subunit beta
MSVQSEEGTVVEVREEDDDLLRAAEELGIDLSASLRARRQGDGESDEAVDMADFSVLTGRPPDEEDEEDLGDADDADELDSVGALQANATEDLEIEEEDQLDAGFDDGFGLDLGEAEAEELETETHED